MLRSRRKRFVVEQKFHRYSSSRCVSDGFRQNIMACTNNVYGQGKGTSKGV